MRDCFSPDLQALSTTGSITAAEVSVFWACASEEKRSAIRTAHRPLMAKFIVVIGFKWKKGVPLSDTQIHQTLR